MRVDTAPIPAQKTALLCTSVLCLVDEIFSDPDTETEYRAWLEKKKKGETNEVQDLP